MWLQLVLTKWTSQFASILFLLVTRLQEQNKQKKTNKKGYLHQVFLGCANYPLLLEPWDALVLKDGHKHAINLHFVSLSSCLLKSVSSREQDQVLPYWVLKIDGQCW